MLIQSTDGSELTGQWPGCVELDSWVCLGIFHGFLLLCLWPVLAAAGQPTVSLGTLDCAAV